MSTLDCAKKYEVYKLARECRTFALDVMEHTVAYDCRYLVKVGTAKVFTLVFLNLWVFARPGKLVSRV